jgi:hypothetical protein
MTAWIAHTFRRGNSFKPGKKYSLKPPQNPPVAPANNDNAV